MWIAMTPDAVTTDSNTRWQRFLIAVGLLAAIWLWVLPQLADWPVIARHIARDERLGINPAAKFYTEHEASLDARLQVEAAWRSLRTPSTVP
jgi:hypothetical protein